jgi:hypothetical protein
LQGSESKTHDAIPATSDGTRMGLAYTSYIASVTNRKVSMTERTVTTKVPPMIFADIPEDGDIEDALLLLAQKGYEIRYNGHTLILDRNTWSWKNQ